MPKSSSSSTSVELPQGKQLASNHKSDRDEVRIHLKSLLKRSSDTFPQAVKQLSEYLTQSRTDPLDPRQMLILWKSIFYCFWMSDKPLIQQALAEDLSNLLLTVKGTSTQSRETASLIFLNAFWATMAREWSGIDRLRLDKYYFLIKSFVRKTFQMLQRDRWNSEHVKQLGLIISIEERPLSLNSKVPLSLGYHIGDVLLDELQLAIQSPVEDDEDSNTIQVEEKVEERSSKKKSSKKQKRKSSGEPPKENSGKNAQNTQLPVLEILRPFAVCAAYTRNSVQYARLMERIFEPLIQDLGPLDASTSLKPQKKKRKTSSSKSTEVVSDEDTPERKYNTILKASGKSAEELRVEVLRLLFDCASNPDACDTQRRKIYRFWQANQGSDEKVESESEGENENAYNPDADDSID